MARVGKREDEAMTEKLPKQTFLFEQKEWWENYWQGMPEYKNQDLGPWKQVIVSFRNRSDMLKFADLIGQTITERTQSVWFPAAEIGRYSNKRYDDES